MCLRVSSLFRRLHVPRLDYYTGGGTGYADGWSHEAVRGLYKLCGGDGGIGS